MTHDPLSDSHPAIGTADFADGREADRNTIAEKIRLDITRGELTFGQRIPEAEYARAFGVSRTPVREALMMLVSLDLVTVKPKYGTFVTQFTRTRLHEVFAARYLLESGGVELANQYQRGKLLSALDEQLARMSAPAAAGVDHEVNHESDTVFHRLLVEAPRNDQLSKMYKPIEVCALAARSRFPKADWVWSTANRHHIAITEAIREDDLECFRASLAEHLNWSRDALMDVPSLFGEA